MSEGAPGQPLDDFLAELDGVVAATMTDQNRVLRAVADGTLSLEFLRRLCQEFYFQGRWFTAEFGSLVANAPDVDALSLSTSEHMRYWAWNLADECGFLGEPNHVALKVEWAHQLGITDAELDAYVPLPETIGVTFTCLYYMRRSYEEGLAAFGWAGERYAATTGYAQLLYEGMREHYGLEVENFRLHAEDEHRDMSVQLLRDVATTAGAQRRVRRAVLHVMTLRAARTRALNAWLELPDAQREVSRT